MDESMGEKKKKICLVLPKRAKKGGKIENNNNYNATPRPSGWESKPRILDYYRPDQCSTIELQKPLPTTWARVQNIY